MVSPGTPDPAATQHSTAFEMTVAAIPDKSAFSLAEVAEITGFSKGSVTAGCREGRIRHQHFGRQRTMTRAQLLEFIAATEVAPKSDATLDAEAIRIEKHRERVRTRLAGRRVAAPVDQRGHTARVTAR